LDGEQVYPTPAAVDIEQKKPATWRVFRRFRGGYAA
jgi:hypothetical protein